MKFLQCLFVVLFIQSMIAQTDSKRVNLGPNVNSSVSELRPFITVDGKSLYMIRDHHPGNLTPNSTNSQDVWVCYLKEDGSWTRALHLGKPFNTQNNNAVFNVSPDNNTFVIRGAWEDGEYQGSGVSVIRKKEKGYSDPEKLVIKEFAKYSDMGTYNGAYMCPDGKTILFYFSNTANDEVSDIYVSFKVEREKDKKVKSMKDFAKMVSKILNNDTWTEPKSLGSVINTPYDEMAPFIASDMTTLYFSSARPGGLGNNDIYMSRRLDDTWEKWSEPVNLGNTINSDDWDSFYSLDAKGEYAYLVSSKNSLGESDIVKVKLKEELRPSPVVLITGTVYNGKTKKPIGASIEYENLSDGKNAGFANSDPESGSYKIVLPYGKNYGFRASADKFISVSDNIDLTKVEQYTEIKRDLYLFPLEVGQTIRLNNIFFDFGKATLRQESFPELDRLVEIMKENTKMEIELSGHTDNVGSDADNLKLSDDRAKSVRDYIVSKGIKAERINAKGYGESKPVADNGTEEGRQENRRVEFTILKN
jgi:OmpA-OmpF porin, OOP family